MPTLKVRAAAEVRAGRGRLVGQDRQRRPARSQGTGAAGKTVPDFLFRGEAQWFGHFRPVFRGQAIQLMVAAQHQQDQAAVRALYHQGFQALPRLDLEQGRHLLDAVCAWRGHLAPLHNGRRARPGRRRRRQFQVGRIVAAVA